MALGLTDILPIISLHGGSMAGWGEESAVIHSCAVNRIRNVYPEPSGAYTGFELADNQGEVEEAWRNFYLCDEEKLLLGHVGQQNI